MKYRYFYDLTERVKYDLLNTAAVDWDDKKRFGFYADAQVFAYAKERYKNKLLKKVKKLTTELELLKKILKELEEFTDV